MLMAVLLSIGAALAWGMAAGWTMTIYIDNVNRRPRQVWESIEVLRDGTPVIKSISDSAGRQTSTTHRTLDGTQVIVRPTGDYLGVANLWVPAGTAPAWTRPSWNERIIQLFRYEITTEAWYAVHDGNWQGHAYIVGFDVSTKRTIGYVGKHGFRFDAPPADDQFPVSVGRFGYSGYFDPDRITFGAAYILTDEGLMQIDWDKQSVRFVFQEDNLISMATWAEYEPDDTKPRKLLFFVRSSDSVRLLDLAGNVQEMFALPAELRNGNLSWAPLGDGRALAWEQGPTVELLWLDATGIVKRQKVDLHRQQNEDSDRKKMTLVSLIAPVPVVCGAVSAIVPLGSQTAPGTGGPWTRLATTVADAWPPMLIVFALGVVLAWLCYRRQRQYGMPWTPAWVVFVFLFGLPGYIGYRTHRRWPTCLPCPSCGRTAPRDRPTCCHCHRDFPAPAANGTEVFAESISVL
jgi:hypothetical protein